MLKISEIFVSVQGEGPFTGAPAIFIRLGGCNLMCGGRDGELVKSGKATWWCDSEALWRNSSKVTSEMIWNMIRYELKYSLISIDALFRGDIHFVITGGEPLLQQEGIVDFIDYLQDQPHDVFTPFFEIETNGTILPTLKTKTFVNFHYNISPKLSNSGIPFEKRIVDSVLRFFSKAETSHIFKIVISNSDDLEEFINNIMLKFPFIDPTQVYLMPGADNRDDLIKNLPKVIKMAKGQAFRVSTRMHITAFDKQTGV